MNIKLTGASLAIAAAAGLSISSLRKKKGSRNARLKIELEDGREASVLGPMKGDPFVNVMIAKDGEEFVAFFRGDERYEEIWRGTELNPDKLSIELVERAT